MIQTDETGRKTVLYPVFIPEGFRDSSVVKYLLGGNITMRKVVYFFCLIFWISVACIGAGLLLSDIAGAASSVPTSERHDARLYDLQQDLDAILASRTIRSAQVGVYLVSLRPDGKPIYTRNAEKAFIPASCMKLFTSAAALDTLGSNFTFKTNVYQKGTVDSQGTLHGDLVIRGSGDPSISGRYRNGKRTAIFEELADQLLASGIHKVEGNIVGDGTFFDHQELGWGWSHDYLDAWYAAKVAALSFNDNCVDAYIGPGKTVGSPATIRFEPPTNYVTAINKVKTTSRGTRAAINWDWIPNTQQIEFSGQVPLRSGETMHYIAVDDPTMYTLTVFKEVLQRKGIMIIGQLQEVQLPMTSPVTPDAKSVASYTSPPLSELLKRVNKNSQNFFAEQLLKTSGAVKYTEGSYANGTKVVEDLMKRSKVDMEGFQQVDGSGLSAYNQVSPEQLVGILQYMYRHPEHQTYYDSMSIPGIDGSLRSRLKNMCSCMRGKTGSIKMVSSLTGYLTTKSGEPIAFSIVFNNFSSRGSAVTAEDKIVNRIAQY